MLSRLSGHGKSTGQHCKPFHSHDIWVLTASFDLILPDVRMRYQNKNVDLPICAEEGKHLPGHPEFCTLEAFKARMKGLIPQDWDRECSVS